MTYLLTVSNPSLGKLTSKQTDKHVCKVFLFKYIQLYRVTEKAYLHKCEFILLTFPIRTTRRLHLLLLLFISLITASLSAWRSINLYFQNKILQTASFFILLILFATFKSVFRRRRPAQINQGLTERLNTVDVCRIETDATDCLYEKIVKAYFSCLLF